MKRLFPLALLVIFGLAGCNQAAPAKAATTDKPAVPPAPAGAAAPIPAPPLPAPETPRGPATFTPQTGSLVSPQDVPLLEQINRENARVLAMVRPTIVRITASMPVDARLEFFGRGPAPSRSGPRAAAINEPTYGSGVVISKDGYIVTNHHVIENAKDVEVELQDKRSFTARVIASDAPMDVAVLKIDATDLTALPWGDSDKVEVGEQVFAIGNPFNLEDSASKGIISAMKRTLPDSPSEGPAYEDYIQTDAAINPGNSGGALVNIHGELIGINTAIASTSRGSMGVGFAIPSNLVRYAVDGLLKNGKLVRGYLGVLLPATVDDGVSDALHLGSTQGALVADVKKKSPADQGGLHSGDFITEVDGHKIVGVADLRLMVAQLPIGKEVTVNYIRDGTPQTTTVKIGLPEGAAEKPDIEAKPSLPGVAEATSTASSTDNVLSGIQLSDLNDKTRKKFDVDPIVATGVIVDNVKEGSVAEAKGIEPGDVIESVCIDRGATKPVANSTEFADAAKNLRSDQSVVLLVHHGNAGAFIYLAPSK